MRKTFIRVDYNGERNNPYSVININSYTRRGDAPIVKEDHLIDINETTQATIPRKTSTYSYSIILVFKENHKFFNINKIHLSPSYLELLQSKINRDEYWSYVRNTSIILENELRLVLKDLQTKTKETNL